MLNSTEEEEVIINAAIAVILLKNNEKIKRGRKHRKPRQCWTRPWLLRRPRYGQYERLLAELAQEDRPGFKNFQRVDPDLFQELLARVGPRIEKQDTFMRKALEPGLRLALTLRYLATGDSYMSLQYNFRVSNNAISAIVPETCEAIIAELQEDVLTCPTTPDEWKKVSEGFATRWNFHNTVGAIDGKHIALHCPAKSGSLYYNYKGFYSIILMALVDADYKFLYIDIGANGRCSDGGVFEDCTLRTALEDGTVGFPPPEPLPNDEEPLSFAIVGDDAFPMRPWLMKPYPQRGMSRK